MPTATTDSPIATITTRPWRSTKCAGATSKPPRRFSSDVTHSTANAATHRTYCASPPAMPPARISAAASTLSRATRAIASTTDADDEREYSPACSSTIARYARPNAVPLPWKAFGIDSASIRKAAIAASSSSRRAVLSGATAFVSHA